MPKELWYPLSQIAEILDKEYEAVASALEMAGVVRVDSGTGFPCAPASYLRSIPAFAKYLRGRHPSDLAPMSPRSLPILEDCEDIFPLRQIKKHHKALFYGDLENADHLDAMLMWGKWRSRKPGPTKYYRLYDFVEPDHWGSEAEKSFRTGGGHLGAMMAEQRRRREGRPVDETKLSPEEEAKAAEHDDEDPLPETPETMDWVKPATSVPGSIPLDLAQDAPKPKPLAEIEGYVKFKFYQRIKQPPASAMDNYLDWIPEGLLYAASARALEWAGLLQEQRTGFRRATDPEYTDTKFKEEFAKVERSIYRERRAWTHGFLTPIMPPNFTFLF